MAKSLTQFIDKDNLVLADSRAGAVLEQLPPLEVFTLHTLSVRENITRASAHFQHKVCVPSLTSSWYRRRGRWDTCRTWPRRPPAACTRRPRTRTGPSRCTAGPCWTCRCRCAWSSCSSHPASLGRTGRSRSYRRHGLGEKGWFSAQNSVLNIC